MNEYIRKISNLEKNFIAQIEIINQISQVRAVVVTLETSLTIDKARLCSAIKNIKIPIILALKISVAAEIVEAFHLCVAGENVNVGEMSAGEAVEKGVINKAVSLEEVETEAEIFAERISNLAPIAIQFCLEAVIEGLKAPLEEGLKLETALFTKIFSTADMHEGTSAFLEKRSPVFKGE